MTKRRNVLVVLCWPDHRIFEGIARYARACGWHLSIREQIMPKHKIRWNGDGVISAVDHVLEPLVAEIRAPFVDLTLAPLDVPATRVITDSRQVGRLAAEHLLACGFETFGYCGNPRMWADSNRCKAFHDALAEAGVDHNHIVDVRRPTTRLRADWDRHRAELVEAIRELPKPIGIFSGQDATAATMIEALTEADIGVPDEVGVLGANNVSYLNDCLPVPLSSIDIGLDRLGWEAAARLDAIMDGKAPVGGDPILVPPTGVVARLSTDTIATSHAGVASALRLFRDDFQRQISAEEIRTATGLSERALYNAFVKHVGRTPAAELRRIRLEHAKWLLIETDWTVDEIARRCGYSTGANLGAAFKSVHGCSPTAHRRNTSDSQ